MLLIFFWLKVFCSKDYFFFLTFSFEFSNFAGYVLVILPELISQLSDTHFQYAVLHVFVLQGIFDTISCLFYFIAFVFFRDLTILVWFTLLIFNICHYPLNFHPFFFLILKFEKKVKLTEKLQAQ